MGFNKKYIKDLKCVKKELEKNPENIVHYINAEALIGPPEAHAYINEFWTKYRNNQLDNAKNN